jgi:hypothetical protein
MVSVISLGNSIGMDWFKTGNFYTKVKFINNKKATVTDCFFVSLMPRINFE